MSSEDQKDRATTQLGEITSDVPATTQRERRPALVFLRGELMAVPIPLERDEVILGRAVEADVRVNDFRASRLHARITAERDPETNVARYRISDLDSTNGTLLNGQPISTAFL